MIENWKPCAGGNYEVSDAGRVRRGTTGRRTWPGRMTKPSLLNIGYYSVAPTVDGKNVRHYVHRLVAEAFLGPCPDGHEVNHINGIKTDNHVSNLEYVTHAENMSAAGRGGLLTRGEAHPGSKLSEADVRAIRAARGDGESFGRIAARFGLSTATVYGIVNRTAWKHVA